MLKFIALFILMLLVIRYLRYIARIMRNRNNVNPNENPTRVHNSSSQQPAHDFKEGEYIEFEEVKE